jgi:dipeptidyl aminopeptidase/acylaminoacyl peptidase
MTTPGGPAELFVQPRGGAARRLTTLNESLLSHRTVAPVESLRFASFDGTPIQAFVTIPTDAGAGASRRPLILMIHGGPHGQQGPLFNAKAQIYASRGWGVLMVNYRGSTGYGQKLADATLGDQDGGEAKDVLAGVDAALTRYKWIDPARLGIEGGSYGGQLTNWIITRTDRFKAAIPSAGVSNLVTQNYLAYFHDYLAVEFGDFPHKGRIMDVLWERSPLRYVARVKTPTMFIHGENDNDVTIAEAEQYFIALEDAGVETIMVRYPREGHGLRETKHIADSVERSIAWYEKHW